MARHAANQPAPADAPSSPRPGLGQLIASSLLLAIWLLFLAAMALTP